MAAPTTIDEFAALVRKSGLVDPGRFEGYLSRLAEAGQAPSDPRKLAGLMIRDGVLTYFQAEQFLLGKWRGFTIGKYKLLERIGFGGMGQVFLCEHMFMRRRVAIKVLPPAKAEEPSALGRFYREARAAGVLDHPNIVRTHDIDQDGPLHFLVMEYVDGTSLLDLVRKFGKVDVLRSAHYMHQSALGLAAAHKAGLVHRDMKPGNIMVDRDGVVKILDLGLARFYNDTTDMLTLKYDEKSVLGTADYVAPEQTINSHDVDIRADIYGLGCTFYFILAGHPPFPDGTVAQKLMYHQNRMPTPIRELRPELPEGLAQVLEYMLAKDPNHRYQTPDEVAAALEPFVVEPIGPPPAAEMPRLSPAAMASPTPSAAPAAESPDDSRDSGLIHREELQKAGIRPTLTAISLPDMPPLPAMPPTWSKPGNQATPPRISPQPTPSGMSVPTVQQTPHRTPPPWAGAGPAAPQVPPPFAPFGRPPNAKPPRRRSNKVTTLIMVVVAGLIGAGIGMVVWSQKGGSPPTKVTPKK